MYRRAILIVTAIIISTSALFGMFPQAANADGTPDPYLASAVLDAAKKSTERNSLGMCIGYDSGAAFKDSDYGYDVDPKNIANGSWFSDYTQIRQWSDYNDGGDGTNCDKFDVNGALSDLGWTSKIQAGCDLGLVRQKSGENCVNGSSHFTYKGGGKSNVLKAIDKVYKGGDYNASQYYVMAMSVLTSSKACKATPIATVAGATADQKAAKDATITVVGSDGMSTQVLYKFGGDQGKKWSFRNGSGGSTDYFTYKCSELAGIANDNASAYAKWVGANPQGTETNPGTCAQYATVQMGGQSSGDTYDKMVAACTKGTQNKGADYCSTTYPTPKHIPNLPPEDQPKPFEQNACLYGQKYAKTSADTGSTDDSVDDKPSCNIQGIGWLVCPVMTFMADINDKAYNFLASYFLSIDTKLVSESQPAWNKFRDIANVAFVIVLLFIVYSQITSVGISNYGIKRMLPRLIAGALLVNVSFWICAAAVDLSNLLGYALPHFFTSIDIGVTAKDSGGMAQVASNLTWVGTIALVIGAAAVGVALAISLPVLLAALLAIGLVVLMLVGRQAFIVLLIVVSPLAFVAYLLPNTEQWFKKWYKMFFALLMLFPVVGAVFGASNMAANIINNTGAESDKIITQLVALAVSAVPFFVVPSLLKGSLAATGALGAKLQGMANKAGGKVGARVKDSTYAGAYMAQRKKISATKRAQSYGKGLRGAVSHSRFSGRAGNELATTGSALATKEEREAVDNEVVAMQKQSGWTEANKLENAQHEFEEAMRAGDATKARAAQQILLSGGNKGISRLQDGYSNLGSSMGVEQYEAMMNAAPAQKALSDLSSAGIKGKNAALTQMSYTAPTTTDANGNKVKTTVDSIANSAGTYNALTDSELAGQSDENLQSAINSGGVSQERASRIRSNDSVWSQLSENKKQMISGVAGPAQAPAQPASGGQQTQAQPQTPAGQLTIPHAGGNPPASLPPASPPHQPPGTSNYTQRPSGLFVPPSSNTPPSNPPSSPPNP